jgi:hypothetical protein
MGHYRNDLVSAASGYGGGHSSGQCYCPAPNNDLFVLAAAAAAAFLLIPLITMMRRRRKRRQDDDAVESQFSLVFAGKMYKTLLA